MTALYVTTTTPRMLIDVNGNGARQVRLQSVGKRKTREAAVQTPTQTVARFIEIGCWSNAARRALEDVLFDTPTDVRSPFLAVFRTQFLARHKAPHNGRFPTRSAWPVLAAMLGDTPLSDETRRVGTLILDALKSDLLTDASEPDWHALARQFFATLDAAALAGLLE